jgi:threonylcarbamoyladenosine tRNA methylthiotransferase MtaB
MSRRCRSDEFRGLVTQARQAVPGMNITTDIIVGFPGETDAEWQETLDLAADMGFGDIHIFAYSPRAGTKAAAMPDQVAHEVKRARSGQLHDLARRSRRRVLEAARGQDFEVLIEGRGEQRSDGGGWWSGYTPNYLRVEVGDTRRDLDNQIVSVRADGLSDDGERLTARLLAKPA